MNEEVSQRIEIIYVIVNKNWLKELLINFKNSYKIGLIIVREFILASNR